MDKFVSRKDLKTQRFFIEIARNFFLCCFVALRETFALCVIVFCAAAPLRADAETVLRRTVDRVSSLDPIMSETVGASRCVMLPYESLLEYDYAARPYKLIGGLAEAPPKISPDGKIYTFKIRAGKIFGPDACFGLDPATGAPKQRELVADDIVYSFKRLADAKLSSPGYWLVEDKIAGIGEFHEASLDTATNTDYSLPVRGLRAPDARTLVIELDAPSPDFIWGLAMSFTAAVPREAVEFYGKNFDSVAVGTGLYNVAKFRRNYGLEFVRKTGGASHGGGEIDRIIYPVIDDASTRWLSFLSGQLDVIGEITRDNWDAVIKDGELAPELRRRGVTLNAKPSLDTYYVGFNLSDPVLGRNKKLRQAMTCAFDSAEWARLNLGRVVPATGPVPPGIDGRLETAPPYFFDLERAQKLLAEAGYENGVDPATGRRLSLTLELGRTDQEIRENAELIASFMGRIGISIKLQYNNWPSFLRKIGRREAQMFLIGWMADYPSALNFLQLFVGKNSSPGPNRANYENPRYDRLFEQAEREMDDAKRMELIHEMQEILREDCPWIFLYHRRDNMLVSPALRNVILHDYPYGMEKHWRKDAAR